MAQPPARDSLRELRLALEDPLRDMSAHRERTIRALLAEFTAELTALREQSKAWEQNDRRYRWLRDRPATIHFDQEIAFIPQSSLRKVYVSMIGNTELDAAIDAALREQRDTSSTEQGSVHSAPASVGVSPDTTEGGAQ